MQKYSYAAKCTVQEQMPKVKKESRLSKEVESLLCILRCFICKTSYITITNLCGDFYICCYPFAPAPSIIPAIRSGYLQVTEYLSSSPKVSPL